MLGRIKKGRYVTAACTLLNNEYLQDHYNLQHYTRQVVACIRLEEWDLQVWDHLEDTASRRCRPLRQWRHRLDLGSRIPHCQPNTSVLYVAIKLQENTTVFTGIVSLFYSNK